MELRRTPPRSRSMSLRGPTAQASRQEQRLSRPEWTRNVPKEECGGKIREGCWQKREERHAPRKARDASFGQRRSRRQSDQPETSDCHRPVRGTQKRCQGPAEKVLTHSKSGLLWKSKRES